MNRSNVKIIFFGTTEFAVPTLEALKNADYQIVTVITNPDEPIGRKKVLAPPPVKAIAEKYGLKILQPEKLRNNSELTGELKNLLKPKIYNLKPSLGILAAYGKIIPPEIINIPKYGILNIHPSLLPKYRGPTPIQSAILNGEKETGITIIKIDEEVDHGDIISKSPIPISNEDDYKTLEDELAKLGAELLIKILPDYLAGRIKPQFQDHSQATFTKKFTREDAKINWSKAAEEINCQIRALNPEPGVWTMWNGKILKILRAEVYPPFTDFVNFHDRENLRKMGQVAEQAGQVFQKENKIAVGTGEDSIILKTVQLEGKKVMSAEDFARGNRDLIGAVLG